MVFPVLVFYQAHSNNRSIYHVNTIDDLLMESKVVKFDVVAGSGAIE